MTISRRLTGWNISVAVPGMYIGKLGDGSYADDGIYVLLKEVLDNSIGRIYEWVTVKP